MTYHAVVIGGGFFGCSIARYLQRPTNRVLLVEQEDRLFARASYANQARIHHGYHYPRSLHTAYRSRVNFRSFLNDFPECVVDNFTSLYCVAKNRSNVSPRQFERFCATIGAPAKPASSQHTKLFNPRLIDSVYQVTEHAFDTSLLRESLRRKLAAIGAEVRLNTRAAHISTHISTHGRNSRVTLSDGSEVEARYVFNCAYAGLARIPGANCSTPLKYEIAEMALIEPPDELRSLSVTVMCGPFFSTMPFPPRGLHTLSHVRYTPHCSWTGSSSDPYQTLRDYPRKTNAHHMLHDAQRYLPSLARARLVDSLFEVKTLLMRNEIDDGRPILVERDGPVFSIMGGKIDNIYDVIHRLEALGL